MNERAKIVLDTLLARRSVREFTKEPLRGDELDALSAAARCAPSGMNRHSRLVTLTRDRDWMKRLEAAVREALDRPADYSFFGCDAMYLLSDEADNVNGLADCACALENLFVMARAMDLGACWINQLKTICDAPAVRQLLTEKRIPENHRVWGMAAVGHTEREMAPRPLKTKEQRDN